MGYWGYGFPPRLTVGQRRAKAAREVAKLKQNGRTVTPVVIDGNKIATTFWGKAWCDNLESYSDFANRLPRGRSYAKNGSVCDLQVEPGKVSGLVCGTELYEVTIKINPLPADAWKAIKAECAGQIGSLIELLQGKLSKAVMEVVTRRDGGLFPRPREIDMDCSCPDWAGMCKHVAATLYGVGARLDHRPDLLFALRRVDHLELIGEAGAATAAAGSRPGRGGRRIATTDLADVFGVDMEPAASAPAPGPSPAGPARSAVAKTGATPARRRGTTKGAKHSSHGRGPETKAGKAVGRRKPDPRRAAARNPA